MTFKQKLYLYRYAKEIWWMPYKTDDFQEDSIREAVKCVQKWLSIEEGRYYDTLSTEAPTHKEKALRNS